MRKNIRLRVLRAERDWNQSLTARRARISLNRYWRIENGETDPTDAERRQLARAFGVPLNQVFPSDSPEPEAVS